MNGIRICVSSRCLSQVAWSVFSVCTLYISICDSNYLKFTIYFFHVGVCFKMCILWIQGNGEELFFFFFYFSKWVFYFLFAVVTHSMTSFSLKMFMLLHLYSYLEATYSLVYNVLWRSFNWFVKVRGDYHNTLSFYWMFWL